MAKVPFAMPAAQRVAMSSTDHSRFDGLKRDLREARSKLEAQRELQMQRNEDVPASLAESQNMYSYLLLIVPQTNSLIVFINLPIPTFLSTCSPARLPRIDFSCTSEPCPTRRAS